MNYSLHSEDFFCKNVREVFVQQYNTLVFWQKFRENNVIGFFSNEIIKYLINLILTEYYLVSRELIFKIFYTLISNVKIFAKIESKILILEYHIF